MSDKIEWPDLNKFEAMFPTLKGKLKPISISKELESELRDKSKDLLVNGPKGQGVQNYNKLPKPTVGK